jgi:flagellar hook-length control protein FliK
MQSAPIKPAQLMMEFMASEQEKISQGISSREFSQHLEEQNRKVGAFQHIQSLEPLNMTNRLSNSLDSQRKVEVKPRRDKKAGAQDDSEDDSRSPRTRARRALPSKNLPMCEWKAAQQLQFTDPMALDKVLTELQLSPSLKEAYKGSESQKGSISLQELSGILDRATSGKETLIADGKAAAADVQSLLASLQNGQRNTSVAVDQFQVKQAGSYNFSEFRQLLKRIAHQTAKQKLSQGASGSFTTPLEQSSDKANLADAAGLASDAKLVAGQTQSLATNFIPSFLKEPGSKAGKAEASSGAVAASKTAEKGNHPFDSWLSDQSNHTMSDPNLKTMTGHDSAQARTPDAGPDHPALLQTLKDLAGPAVPQGAAGATPPRDQAANAQPAAAGPDNDTARPQLGDGVNAAPSAAMSAPGTSGANVQNTASSLVDSLKSHGEAVIRSYHFEPETNRNVTGQDLAAGAVGEKTTTTVAMEKIAAPGGANTAASQDGQGQAGCFSFAKDGAQSLLAKSSTATGTPPGQSLLEGTSWSEALSERIQDLHKQKQNQLTLELDSKDLGRILLRVETEHNQVKAVITTESEHAQELLAKASPLLRQQLESQGLVLSQLQIDLRHHGGERQGYHNQPGRRGRGGSTGGRSAARNNDPVPGLDNVAGRYSENQIINVFA